MPITRRTLIKQSVGAVSLSVLMPNLMFAGQAGTANPNRKILVLIELTGGNDGLNTVIPHTNSRYHELRPFLGLRTEDLVDQDGNSTLLNDEFGLHPAMKELKKFYDDRKAAIVLGVGYDNPSFSHFTSLAYWHSGTLKGGLGWIGRYADDVLANKSPLSVVSVTNGFTAIVSGARANVTKLTKLGESQFKSAPFSDGANLLNAFRKLNGRQFAAGSFIERIAEVGSNAERSGALLQEQLRLYQSSVTYPDDNPLAQAMKVIAQIAAVFPYADVFHIGYAGAFDSHARQIGTLQDEFKSKTTGVHAVEMKRLSQAIKLFYDDMSEHGLNENLLMMTYSEFGRRPNENASRGTDHGAPSCLFVVGDKVKGGDLYGLQPSLNAVDFDISGNMKFTTDYRSVYATVLDKWLVGGDSKQILGANFALLGFL
jgi:uncharacterized protein (DUF1501 family)